MSVPVITFFNNKGGVGKTSLCYHLAWMLSELNFTVLACDLDPQANLTAAFLDETQLEALLRNHDASDASKTVFQCIEPLTKVADLQQPDLEKIEESLFLLPGDLALSSFESTISDAWAPALGNSPYRPMRILASFWILIQQGAARCNADVALIDVGPNLGAINRSALIATDKIVIPLAADLFSLQGLRNLGPMLNTWHEQWRQRIRHWAKPEFALPQGNMEPLGYVVQQYGIRHNRPVKAFDRWVNRMPKEYAKLISSDNTRPAPSNPSEDEHCLATMKHYRSLIPMAQEARKPIFHLTSADGAIGGHAYAVRQASEDYRRLATRIAKRVGLSTAL